MEADYRQAQMNRGRYKPSPKYFGAGKESRTLDLNLGKVALYQLSYSRIDRIIAENRDPSNCVVLRRYPLQA